VGHTLRIGRPVDFVDQSVAPNCENIFFRVRHLLRHRKDQGFFAARKRRQKLKSHPRKSTTHPSPWAIQDACLAHIRTETAEDPMNAGYVPYYTPGVSAVPQGGRTNIGFGIANSRDRKVSGLEESIPAGRIMQPRRYTMEWDFLARATGDIANALEGRAGIGGAWDLNVIFPPSITGRMPFTYEATRGDTKVSGQGVWFRATGLVQLSNDGRPVRVAGERFLAHGHATQPK
jgi:hypothetical protein